MYSNRIQASAHVLIEFDRLSEEQNVWMAAKSRALVALSVSSLGAQSVYRYSAWQT